MYYNLSWNHSAQLDSGLDDGTHRNRFEHSPLGI